VPLSCHVYRVSAGLKNSFPGNLKSLSEKSPLQVRLRALAGKQFVIKINSTKNISGDIRYYVLEYPEPVEFTDYETGEHVKKYKKAKTYIILQGDNPLLVFLCGGNIAKAKNIIEELMSGQIGQILFPFTISASELEYLIKNYGFEVRYTRLDSTHLPNVDRLALWGSDVSRADLYRGLRGSSGDPDKEVRLLDRSYEDIGTVGITRAHEDTKALAIRIWKNQQPDVLAKYIVERIIKPVLKLRKAARNS